MIELDALKEQLRLLGHDLPDDQICAILKDMNIDHVTTAEPASSLGERWLVNCVRRRPRT